ncbi:hypothetical protein BGZ98_010430 [Dissophora globulifera]|nr:hypothetical protein BGZ98_010430 [Dissophora globulifera]
MALYSTHNDQSIRSYYLSRSLNHLSEQAGTTLFSIKNVSLACSQTVFNPDGTRVADVVEITVRSSTISSNTVDLQFFYDPYDWSFPPDLIIHGMPISPSLSDLGLDDSWDHENPANLSGVLSKLSRMMQVIFAVPFYVAYTHEGKKRRTKVVAKIQFLISSLIPNDVTAVKSKVETLTPFEHQELLNSIPEMGKQETITAFIERATQKISGHFEKEARSRILRKEFIETITTTFRKQLLECDLVDYTFASFLFVVPKTKVRSESTAIASFYVSDTFPDEYPKLTLSAPVLPVNTYSLTPRAEVVPIIRYSPRWGAERIVDEIWEQLWEDIPRFHSKLSQASASSVSLV